MVAKVILIVAFFGIALAGANHCKRNGAHCHRDENCCSHSCKSNSCEALPTPSEEQSMDYVDDSSDVMTNDEAAWDLLKTIILQPAAVDESLPTCVFPGLKCHKNKDCCSHRCLPVVKRCSV